MRINVRGFIVLDYMEKFPKAIELFKKNLHEGKLKIEGGEFVVKADFEEVPKTWLKLFHGGNQGKLITALQ